jgi:hypothetical protein
VAIPENFRFADSYRPAPLRQEPGPCQRQLEREEHDLGPLDRAAGRPALELAKGDEREIGGRRREQE